jgi:nucleoside-diphosphate-sugar epimerase
VKVLLTGATGFIGSHLAKLLVSQGCEVYALIRPSSDLWRIKDIDSRLHLVYGDLLALDFTHLAALHPDLCIHAAWYVEPGRYLTSQENLGMLSASLHLAAELARAGCPRFVGIGTCFEYDVNLGYLAEDSPTKPGTLYGASKLATQLVLSQLASVTGMSVAWLRLFYQYGPFERPQRLVPAVICALLQNQEAKVTEGNQAKDFLHIEDVAAAVWAVAQSDLPGPVNIGSGYPVILRDLIYKIAEKLGRRELIRLGAIPSAANEPNLLVANARCLYDKVGWQPKYTLDTGLEQTIAWWKMRLGLVDQGGRHGRKSD